MSSRIVPQITLLNGMLGRDFTTSLDRHKKLELHLLDLKDSIFGKNVADLTKEEAFRARSLIDERGLEVYTLSSSLCHEDIEQGEVFFRQKVEADLNKILTVASILKPQSVRLLSAWTSLRTKLPNSLEHLDRNHPWIYDVYRECIGRLDQEGYAVFIENEADKNILSTVAEIHGFFQRVNSGNRVRFTWDIQNLWQMGTAPSVGVYEELKELVGYLHFKGGIAGYEGQLLWASSLQEASWPVAEIAERAISDGVIGVFCLNPSHGQFKAGYDSLATTESDIHFLQALVNKG